MIRLHIQIPVRAPVERCFDLARSIELHAASARPIRGRAVAGRTHGLAELHDRTTWSARFFGVRFSLTTQITTFDRPWSFSDVLCEGLFDHFGHVYSFHAVGIGQTVMIDDFFFQSPLGLLGVAFDAIVLRQRMRVVALGRAHYIRRVAESEAWRQYL